MGRSSHVAPPSGGLGWGHPQGEWPPALWVGTISQWRRAVYRGDPLSLVGLQGSCPSTRNGLHPQKIQKITVCVLLSEHGQMPPPPYLLGTRVLPGRRHGVFKAKTGRRHGPLGACRLSP